LKEKVAEEFQELKASNEELLVFSPFSWSKELSLRNLTIPSFTWINQCEILSEEFENYHNYCGIHKLSTLPGVYKGFNNALIKKYPQIPSLPLKKYMWTRLCIRIKNSNKKIQEDRCEKAKERTKRWMESLRNAGAKEEDVEKDYDEEDYDEDDYDEESEENESDDEDPEPNLRYSEINLHEVNGFQEYMEQNITGMEN
jgi:hypothetical protein